MEKTINISDFPDNDGAIIEAGGKKFAVFKDSGELKVFSSKCTHMHCDIEWQKDDKMWKCPCHGACYKATGEVLKGPAERSLDKTELPKDTNIFTIKESNKRSFDEFKF
ncbi:MAG: Rieske 2Fe-2S domain-containing protein [Patescibacteria group bacterium]